MYLYISDSFPSPNPTTKLMGFFFGFVLLCFPKLFCTDSVLCVLLGGPFAEARIEPRSIEPRTEPYARHLNPCSRWPQVNKSQITRWGFITSV